MYYYNAKSVVRPYSVDSSIHSPTIIICNGDAGNMLSLVSYATQFITKGFNVLTFDWRGFGESERMTVDTNYIIYKEFLTDYDAIINAVINIKTVDKNRI